MNDWAFEPQPAPFLAIAGSKDRFPVRRIYCVGQNYAEHVREMGGSGRELPVFFDKPADAVSLTPELAYPPGTKNLHHEVELVVALKSGGRSLTPEQAAGCIFGYAVGVDLTRRDLQADAKKKGAPWTTAKGFDASAPLSPVRPAADCGDVSSAEIQLSVNGELRQRSSTSEMIWSVPEIIAELSRLFELKAGDLVFTGTPEGVGPLQRGDRVECAVEGVGELAFQVV